MSLYDDMVAALRGIDMLPPFPAKLECGPRVFYTLRRDYYADPAHIPSGMPQAPGPGVPIHVLRDMDERAWRFLDGDGNVIQEGSL